MLPRKLYHKLRGISLLVYRNVALDNRWMVSGVGVCIVHVLPTEKSVDSVTNARTRCALNISKSSATIVSLDELMPINTIELMYKIT